LIAVAPIVQYWRMRCRFAAHARNERAFQWQRRP
jgi:hypothetical protein